MSRKLTILFTTMDFVGPINALTGIGEVLRDRGHKVVFVVSKNWTKRLKNYGFEVEIIGENYDQIDDSAKYSTEQCLRCGRLGPRPPLDKELDRLKVYEEMITYMKQTEPRMREIIETVKPDIIIIENIIRIPSVMDCGIPWIQSLSVNPLGVNNSVDNDMIPPNGLGVDTNGNPEEWKRLKEIKRKSRRHLWKEFNDWLISQNSTALPPNMFMTESQYLNIYMFPEELDYKNIMPSNWQRFDHFMRSEKFLNYKIPENLMSRSGKLIFLSMGSMGGADVQLMKKFVSILSKSNHRFIISKGPFADQYELADNMCGESFVPQIAVLPIVDLVITHGGNNTVTEVFYFGKPMIVMPLFYDQYDNAQRLHEMGFGIRLDPYECSENQLLVSIEKLLTDEKLAIKMRNISERIQKSKSRERLTEMIENLVKTN